MYSVSDITHNYVFVTRPDHRANTNDVISVININTDQPKMSPLFPTLGSELSNQQRIVIDVDMYN